MSILIITLLVIFLAMVNKYDLLGVTLGKQYKTVESEHLQNEYIIHKDMTNKLEYTVDSNGLIKLI